MPQTYTFASWNVNGLRAVLKKDPSFIQIAQELDVDILALQETKLQEGQVDIDLPGYHQTWSYAERKGYSGTAVFSRQEPLRVLHADALLPYAGEGEAAELVAQAATEGRVCALEFDKFWFVDVYTPNAQNELARIDVRMAWDDAYRDFLSALERETGKPVVTCGDFNVAHAATQAFRTRSAASLPSCSTPALPIPGARQIRTSRASTAGGAIALMPARTTPAGASTTSW